MIRRISPLFVALLFACAALGRDEYTRTFDKAIPVHAGVRVLLEHKLGDITIHTHNNPEVVIHADIRVSARNQQDAKTLADRIDVLIDSSSSVLSIRTRYPERSESLFGNNTSYSVRYDVTIPESSPLDVHSSFGAVSVTGVKASSNITNSHGDLVFRDGQGTQRLDNSFARIEVSNNVGDVTVEGSNGAIDARDVNGAIGIRNRFGNVTVSRVSKGVRVVNSNGAVQITDSGGSGSSVKNAFGDVRASTFHGDLTVNNSNGRVEATDVDGAAELNSSFGDVRFSNIGRQLSVRSNNGKVDGSRVGGSINVVNSFGQVTVRDIQGSAHVESGNSGVSISGVKEDARIKTSFGAVEASNIGGLLTVENSNGSVKASNVKGAQINTSFGAVVLDSVNGGIQVENQNGAVDATSTLQGACQPIAIRTSFSAIRVRLSSDASYRVEARTSFGKIRSEFPINVMGSMSSDQLSGTIGGGHCELRLTDNNGAIEILKH